MLSDTKLTVSATVEYHLDEDRLQQERQSLPGGLQRGQTRGVFRVVRENCHGTLVFSNVGLLSGVEFLGPSNSTLEEAALLRS
jgi:hypothetical protein